MNERIYPIQNGEREFQVGVANDARQVMMGTHSSHEIIALFFDQLGRLKFHEVRTLPAEPRVVGDNPYDPVRATKFENAIKQWKAELGFIPATIHVRQFDCEGNRIEDLPEHYKEFLENPLNVEPDRNKWPEWRELIEHWMNEGMYVLWWGKDYWMDGDGNVDST